MWSDILVLLAANSLLAQSHNAPLLPPKTFAYHWLQFLLGHENVPREVETNAYANFWGVKRCLKGFVQLSSE